MENLKLSKREGQMMAENEIETKIKQIVIVIDQLSEDIHIPHP